MGNENIEEVFISLVHFPVNTLGPGVRIGIWFQGCDKKCKNCLSPHTWEMEKGEKFSLSELKEKMDFFIKVGKAEGLTISGGEPFLQPEVLKEILDFTKGLGIDDRLVYTGYEYSEIERNFPWIKTCAEVIIDGEYIEGYESQYIWKGSENQNLIILSENEKIIRKYTEYKSKRKDKKLQLVEKNGNVYIVGIPEQKDREKLVKI